MPYAKPEDLDSALRSGKLGSLYLFDGPENWLKERAVNRILKKLITPENADFNLDRLDGRSCSGGDIVSSAQSLPWMADRRLVIVQAAEELSAADGRLVGEALPELPKTTCLIFVYQGKANLREEIPAHAMSAGAVVTFWPPFPNQMPAWAVSEAKTRGKSLSFDAAAALCEACTDLQEISNELDKLALFVGKKPSIDLADVRDHGLPDQIGDFKQFEEAIWTRDLQEAVHQGRMLSEAGVRTEAALPVIERVLRTLLMGHYYLKVKGWPMADALAALRIRGKTQQGLFEKGLRAYRPDTLESAFARLSDTDEHVKTGVLPSDIALTLVLFEVMGERKKAALALGNR